MAKHQFQTEVGQLLHLMTHSLYSNKEIFIRELVSNSSDAIDKLNYLRLTDEKLKESFASWKGEINISFDEKDKSLTIVDNGIGMNEEDMINSIGTIAKSGTKSFVEALTGDAKKDSNLIGQFGVGFYSVFMVAEKVDVISKKAGEDTAYKWSSTGTGEFDLSACTKESAGTVIYIKLKDDEVSEFASKYRIKNIVEKYSNHIAYPIFLNYDEEVTQTLSEEDKKAGKEAVKTIERKHEQINAATALWTQAKAKLKDEDYNSFYKSISQEFRPILTIHTKTEGVNEYTTLFYIPKIAPMDMYRADYQSGIKLYVKRVFITDDDRELLPTYLRFVRGIIDSEDLPLNVSREILQENRILANIKQSSVKKILSEIKKLSKDEEKYSQFISQYNRALKEGVYQDYTNKESILELLRYKSTADEKKLTSLEDYKQRANSEQKAIYYIVGDNEKVLRNSPLLESYKKNNIEVLILDDKEIDEIITPTIGAFKEWQFTDITTAQAPKVEVNEEEKQKIEEEFKDIVSKIKDKLGSEVKDVKITSRLDSFASCITKDAGDAQMAAMAHMFRAMGQEAPEVKPILEINPNHEIVKKLQSSTNDELIEDVSWILLDLAKISEGVDVSDKVAFAKRLTKITSLAM